MNHGLRELLYPAVKLMVSIETCSQSRAADQSKEGETTADRPRFSFLQNIVINEEIDFITVSQVDRDNNIICVLYEIKKIILLTTLAFEDGSANANTE